MSFCFNYNDYVSQNNTIKGKIVSKYIIFQKKYIADEIKNVNFVNKTSVQNDSLLFTNKFERKNSQRIIALRNMICLLKKNPNFIKDYFDGRDLDCRTSNDQKKLDRLDKILKLNKNIPNSVFLIKCVPNIKYYKLINCGDFERGFQLFLTYKKGYVTIYLIDLYHLAIPSRDNDLIKEYYLRKKYKKDLLETIFLDEINDVYDDKELVVN